MPPSLIAPNVDNYQVGKGIVSFKPAGASAFIDLGNVAELEFEATIEKLDHFSSRQGVRTKDASIILERGGTIRVLMEEFTAQNLAMVLLGTIDEAAVGGPEIDIFTISSNRGELKFVATADVGPRWDLHYYNVDFAPSGSFNPISDEWNNMEVTGEVLLAPTGHPNAGKTGIAKLTNLGTAPTIGTLTPNTGAAAGGVAVTIAGTNFTGATGVTFGGVAGTSFAVASATEIDVTTPAHAAGAVDVVVQHPSGNVTKANGFTYS